MGAGDGDRNNAGGVTSQGDGEAAAHFRTPSRSGRRRAESTTGAHSSPTLDLKGEALAQPNAHRTGRDVVGAVRGVSPNVDFKPKRRAREVVNLALLASLVATAMGTYVAYDERTDKNIGIAATLGVLTLVIWAARASAPVTTLSVVAGQLKVRSGGRRYTFDLTSHYVPIEVKGRPGRSNWRVLFGRGDLPPFVVDSSMVDPRHFMQVLRQYRPDF